MENEAQGITVIQKAANVCVYCRGRKQRCDRILPSCSRCAAKQRPCDYTSAPELRHQDSHDSGFLQPLFSHVGPRGPDLTSRGRSELLQATTECMTHAPGSLHALSEVIFEIFDGADVTVASLLEEYTACMHRWIPLVELDQLTRDNSRPGPLLLLAMFLVTRRPEKSIESLKTGVLYMTLKQIVAVGQTDGDTYLEFIQTTMVLAIYECAHGMVRQAHVTLSSCVAMTTLLDLGTPQQLDAEDTLIPLHVAILVLDRILVLSSLDYDLPLACPSNHPLTRHVSSYLSRHAIGAYQADPVLKAARKLKVQAQVNVVTGRVLEYVHAIKRNKEPPENYEVLDRDMTAVAKSLVEKEQGHSWLMCDCIAMGFLALILLQQIRNQQPDADPRAGLALRYARRMAWDMNALLIEKLDHEDIALLPFGGLCCVVRAAVAVAETSFDDNIPIQELVGILPALTRFEERWRIGVSYRVQVVESIRSLAQNSPSCGSRIVSGMDCRIGELEVDWNVARSAA